MKPHGAKFPESNMVPARCAWRLRMAILFKPLCGALAEHAGKRLATLTARESPELERVPHAARGRLKELT